MRRRGIEGGERERQRPSSSFVFFSGRVFSTNGHRSWWLSTEAGLATMRRVLGVKIRTGPAITTLRAGARTSGQTSMFGSALGGIRFAHPIMLLNLLRTYRIALPRWVPGDRRSHLSGRRRLAAVGRAIPRSKVLVLGGRGPAHARAGGTVGSRRGLAVPSALREGGWWWVVAHPAGRERIGPRSRGHVVPVN